MYQRLLDWANPHIPQDRKDALKVDRHIRVRDVFNKAPSSCREDRLHRDESEQSGNGVGSVNRPSPRLGDVDCGEPAKTDIGQTTTVTESGETTTITTTTTTTTTTTITAITAREPKHICERCAFTEQRQYTGWLLMNDTDKFDSIPRRSSGRIGV